MKTCCRILLLFCCLVIGYENGFSQILPFAGGSGIFTHLIWSEEFNYTGLPDSSKWNYEQGYLRNHELQFYTTARKENAFVSDGHLTITALADSAQSGHPVTSASIVTKGRQDWTYGRIEIRAKIPSSLGTWPAIWMLGSDNTGWPACGEIDIMEHVGYMPDTLHFNVRTEKYNHVKKTNKGAKIALKSPDAGYHVYAIEWFPDGIDWYLDDKKVFSFANEGGKAAWPFDEPQYLILNLAFGGDWGGSKGVDLKMLPQRFLIDYVRVFL